MKFLKLCIGLLPLFLFSCDKKFVENENSKYLTQNIEEIRAYLTANNIDDVMEDPSGIFWLKTLEDTTARVATSDVTIQVAYKISNLRGQELVSVTAEDSVFFNFGSNVFDGFVAAVSTLREGEKGTFYIPALYAYAGTPPSDFNLNAWESIILEIENVKFYGESELIDVYVKNSGLGVPEKTSTGLRIFRNEPRPETADVKAGDNVSIKYKGYLLNKNKTVFDEGSFNHVVGSTGLIPGFEEALTNMRISEKVTIIIPSKYAYGVTGSSDGSIPPNTPIAFDLEIVSKSN